MSTRDLLLRCFADRNEYGWQAFCLDLDLAAQGDTFEEARESLSEMIREYVYDALVGEHREHAEVLMTRRAPASLWARYYWYQLLQRVRHTKNGVSRPFRQPLPVAIAQV